MCAGDLTPIGTGAVRYAAEEWAEARRILDVPGKHEYDGTDIDRGREQLAEECYRLGIALLNPDAIVTARCHDGEAETTAQLRCQHRVRCESARHDGA